MRVNSLLKNRSKFPYFRRILVLLGIFASGVIIFSFFDAAIIAVVSPVWKVENIIGRNLRQGVAFFSRQKTLVAENAGLKKKISSLEMEILSLSNQKVQEDVLQGLLKGRQKPNLVVAAVLTHPPQTPYDTIIIDAGSNQSVALGSEVSLPEGPILGLVSEVFPKQAKVKLFSSSGEETNAILERNNVPVMLVGIGGGNFKLMLPREILVEKGDRILSPDITLRPLAIVGEVSMRATDSFQEILAKSPTSIFALRFVFVAP